MIDSSELGPTTEQRSTQLQDTIRVTIQALNEFKPPAPSTPENKGLKGAWVDRLKEYLTRHLEEAGKDRESVTIPTYADASLTSQTERGFFGVYMSNFGSPLSHESIGEYASGRAGRAVPEDRIEEPREDYVVRVVDANGRIRFLATKTKIDGLQILLDGSAITKPNSSDRTVRPTLLIGNKS